MTTKKSNRERILDAAIECIERYGVTKTTMDDITDAAKLSRMSVYRVFRTRADLLNEIVLMRLKSMTNQLIPIIQSYDNFEDVIIDGSIKSIELSRKDEIYLSIIEHTGDKSVERFMINQESPVHDLIYKEFKKAFSTARKKGLLRNNLTDNEIMTWLRSVHLILYLREDLDVKGQRQLLKKFVMPSILANPH